MSESTTTNRQSEFIGKLAALLATPAGPVSESSTKDRRRVVAELLQSSLAPLELRAASHTLSNYSARELRECPTKTLRFDKIPFTWRPALANRRIGGEAFDLLIQERQSTSTAIDRAIRNIAAQDDSLGKHLRSLASKSGSGSAARIAAYKASSMTWLNRLLEFIPLEILRDGFEVSYGADTTKVSLPIAGVSGRTTTIKLEAKLDLQIRTRGSSDSTVFVTVASDDSESSIEGLVSLLANARAPKGLLRINPSSGSIASQSYSRGSVKGWLEECATLIGLSQTLAVSDTDATNQLFQSLAKPGSQCPFCPNLKHCPPGQIEADFLRDSGY